MKKLTQLKRNLSNKEILASQEAQDIKGGQRFITRNYVLALIKNHILKNQGKQTKMVSHNGEYCIEW